MYVWRATHGRPSRLPPPPTPNTPHKTQPQLFLDAHLLAHRANRVAVLAASPERSAFLYPAPHTPTPPAAEGEGISNGQPAEAPAVADRVGQAVVEGLRRLLGARGEEGEGGDQQEGEGGQQQPRRRQGSLVAQALSKGLCCKWMDGTMDG